MILQPGISLVAPVCSEGEIIRESLAEVVEELVQAVLVSVGAATILSAIGALCRRFSFRAGSRLTAVR